MQERPLKKGHWEDKQTRLYMKAMAVITLQDAMRMDR
jgi:hypothetical protein